jgi:hypothetical protein
MLARYPVGGIRRPETYFRWSAQTMNRRAFGTLVIAAGALGIPAAQLTPLPAGLLIEFGGTGSLDFISRLQQQCARSEVVDFQTGKYFAKVHVVCMAAERSLDGKSTVSAMVQTL